MMSIHDPRFLRFLAVGALNTVFGYSVFAALILIGVHYAVAALVSTVAGVLFNFKTTGTFVFSNRENRLLFRFVAVYALTYVVGVGLLRWSEGRGIPVLLAAAVLTLPMAAFSFTLQRLFVFREG
ncbi:MAG TPA: GtrA family protein [Thermoanaerobaculia bacterium]|nr:GtrA family protein [Thermoanaerobaculia bacterium]